MRYRNFLIDLEMFLMVYLFIAVIKMEKSETALKSINEIMKVINEKDEKVWADQAFIKCKTRYLLLGFY